MAENGRLRVETKRSERIAGLLAPIVGFFTLSCLGFVLLELFQILLKSVAAKPKDFFTIALTFAAIGVVTSLTGFFALLLMGIIHDALAVYEFTPQGVSKRSPFWEQRANWSEVTGWVIVKSDGIWRLLDKKGRMLLSLRWHTLPNEQVPAAKAFVVDHLSRQFSAPPSATQTLLSRLRHSRRLFLWMWVMMLLVLLALSGYLLAPWSLKEVFVAMVVVMALIVNIINIFGFSLNGSLSAFIRAKFLVCGDQLIEPASGVIIHLPSVRRLESVSDGIILVGADGRTISIPSHLTALFDYLRARLPSEWQE